MHKIKWTSLKDNEDLKQEIGLIIFRINRVLENDSERHLADVGCLLSFVAKDLELLSEKVFERHEEQKIVR